VAPTPIPRTAFGTTALALGILGAILGLVTPALLFVIPMGLGILAVIFGTIAVYLVAKHRANNKVISILGPSSWASWRSYSAYGVSPGSIRRSTN
jgi:hypothetical protein